MASLEPTPGASIPALGAVAGAGQPATVTVEPRLAPPAGGALPSTSARRKRLWWLPPAVAIAGLLPVVKLVADGLTGHLGANPVEAGLNRLGWWTLLFLTASLAPTPLNELVGLKWPVRIRRTLGLLAFTYAALHFVWYLGVDKFFDLGDVARDVTKRKFITIGFATLVLLAPLAITSTDASVRRMGFVRWKRLHRLVYVAVLLGVIHFLWRVKADHREPSVFAVVVVALLATRFLPWLARRRETARARR